MKSLSIIYVAGTAVLFGTCFMGMYMWTTGDSSITALAVEELFAITMVMVLYKIETNNIKNNSFLRDVNVGDVQ